MASIGQEGAKRRREHILSRARELAKSGRSSDCRAIGWLLSEEGYPEARHVLRGREVRVELDELCRLNHVDHESSV
jgi:hypothetical protein